MRNFKPLAFTLLATLSFSGCSPDSPSGNTALENFPGELTKSEYNSLTSEQKYSVSTKLMSTMFKGIAVADFYDLSKGMANLELKAVGNNLLGDTKRAISTPLTQEQRNLHDMIIMGYNDIGGDRSIQSKFEILDDDGVLVEDWPKQQPLARIMQFPLSKETFDNYVAYILVNTILFAPAEEIDSASIRDVQKVFNKLYDDLRNNRTMQQIIARHQRTQENWRRFRSPEDNTREMIEIYLGLFDRDADVPRASIACQDLYLTDADADYELLSTGFANTEPQYVLDTFVTSCGDFYDVVANHPRVVPRMVTVLVEYFFFNSPSDKRSEIVNQIVAAGPTTFQEVVKSIVFSKEYLLNNERPKSFEENLFGMAQRSKWKAYEEVLQDLTLEADDNGASGERLTASMAGMGWPTMTLKLGRFTGVPLDALSFASYHRGLREIILVDGTDGANGGRCDERTDLRNENIHDNECKWSEGLGLVTPLEPVDPVLRTDESDTVLTSEPLDEELAKYEIDFAEYNRIISVQAQVYDLSVEDYLDYLFMTVVSRKASDIEKTELISMIMDNKSFISTNSDDELVVSTNPSDGRRSRQTNHDEIAKIVFDYLSRLPETYYFHKIN